MKHKYETAEELYEGTGEDSRPNYSPEILISF